MNTTPKGAVFLSCFFCIFVDDVHNIECHMLTNLEPQILTLQVERDRSVIVYLFVPRAANTKCWQTACLVSRQRLPEGGGPVNGFGLCANSG